MPRIPSALASLPILLPACLAAQEPHILRDAGLPRQGEVWLQVEPALVDWDERFGPGAGRRPLHADFEGPVLSRLFPPIGEGILAQVNAGAGVLGYDPLALDDVSVGGLEFGTVQAQVVRALASLRVGLLDRVALEVGLPIVSTRVEPLFAWDTASATVARASVALPDAAGLLSGLEDARSTLQMQIDGGGLSPEQEEQALALLDDFGAFLDALRAGVEQDRFLPLAGTIAGAQMLARFETLSGGFDGFQIALPSLGLRETPGIADLQSFFTGDPLGGPLPGTSDQAFQAGELEAGVLVGLLDTSGDEDASLRFRTSAGATLRIPTRDADAPPFADRTDPFRVPIGDGQRDLELALYQDLWIGTRWRVGAAGRFGIQAADELLVRVHPPDRPFARPESEAADRRDLGDYLQLRLAPQYLLNDVMALGIEYGFWRKGADEFRLLEAVPGLDDADPLELESAETRHRAGFGVFFRPAERRRAAPDGSDPSEPDAADGSVSDDEEAGDPLPWRLGVVLQWSLSGSGGAPASRLLMATFRVPFRPF